MAEYAVSLTTAGQGVKFFGPVGASNVAYEIDFASEISGVGANFYIFDGRSGASALYLLINSSGKIQFDSSKFGGADIDGVPQSWTNMVTPFVGSGLDTIAGKTLRIYHNGETLGGSYNGSFFVGSRYNSIDSGVMQVSGIRALVSGSPVSNYLMNEGAGSAFVDSLATYSDGVFVGYVDDSAWVLLGGGDSESLLVDSTSQSQILSQPPLGVVASLSVSGLSQPQLVSDAIIIQHSTIVIDPVQQEQSMSVPFLTQAHILTVNSFAQSQSSGQVNLIQAGALSVNAVDQSQILGSSTLTHHGILDVDDLAQSVGLSVVSFLVSASLAVNAVSQSQEVSGVTLLQHNNLAVFGLRQSQTVSESLLHVLGQISPSPLTQVQLLDAAAIMQHHAITVDKIGQVQAIGNITLDISNALTLAGLSQLQGVDASTLSSISILSVDSLTQSQIVELVRFGGAIIGSLKGQIVICSMIDGAVTISKLLDGNVSIH